MKELFQLTTLRIAALATVATLAFIGCQTDNTGVKIESTTAQNDPFTAQSGGSGTGCPGAYNGFSKMTNSSGTFFITPPAGTTSGTFTDASGFAAPYVSVAYVKRKSDGATWCDTNSVTFPATNTQQYSLTVYVKSTLPPPTNGQPMNLQVTWQ